MKPKIGAAPTLESGAACKRVLEYPESDGEPMAETPKHQQVMIDCMDTLRRHFREVPDVFIAGNMFLYYEEGNPRKSISPDVFMVHGVSEKDIRTYKTWEHPPTLDFVLEVASPSTIENDLTRKKEIYATLLRVKEYYIYDPYHESDPFFIGFRLVGEVYQEIPFVDGRLSSRVLGLELGEYEGLLRLYNPVTSVWLLPSQERIDAAETRADAAETRANAAETRASQESIARQTLEAELAAARAALKQLQTSEESEAGGTS